LGPLEAILKAESEKRATISANSGISGLARSFSTSMRRISGNVEQGEPQIQLKDLMAVRVLGSGTFGLVKLVVHRNTGAEYALKTMSKKTVIDLRQEKGVYRERDLMRELDSPLLPALFATFSDSDNLYMVLEYLPGGEFWGLMHEDPNVLGYTNLGGLPVQSAVFYAANVVAAISHMHSVGICYRDLKPENMVIPSRLILF
jgi:serine/threonine protein kinase